MTGAWHSLSGFKQQWETKRHSYLLAWHSMEENKMNVGENDVILQKLRCMESSPISACPALP